MKNLFITFLLTLMIATISFREVSAQSPTPSSTTPASEEITENLSEQINSLKEKVASRVAQLNLVEKRGTMGTVKEVKGMQITLTDPQGEEQVVDIDEITKFTSSSQSNFGISDIEKNDKLSIIGLYNKDSERILARFITVTTIPNFVSGAITSIDDTNNVLTITTQEDTEVKVDVENVTRIFAYTKDDIENPSRSEFAQIERGERVIAIGYSDTKEENRVTATRILLLADLPQNPHIVIPEQAVDIENVTTSTGSANKLTPLR